jgi:rSAM/selenodomain-associated transferase 2
MKPYSISVIIPTHNEAENIDALLSYLHNLDDTLEIIVADAGSTDKTVEKAKHLSHIVQSAKGRGVQMNEGAKAAGGDVLWFIHADCYPPPDAVDEIHRALRNPAVVGGGFEYALNHPAFRFRVVEFLSNRKNHLLKWLFGDMGIFIRREIFEKMGGYAEIPLMEDMDFSKRLKQYGKIVILPQRMKTSARRWIEDGYVFHSLRSWIFQSTWSLGVSPETLSKYYKFK